MWKIKTVDGIYFITREKDCCAMQFEIKLEKQVVVVDDEGMKIVWRQSLLYFNWWHSQHNESVYESETQKAHW